MKKLLLTLALTLASSRAAQIYVTWDPNPPEEFITHYNLYVSTEPNVWTQLSTTNTFMLLSVEKTAYIKVQAVADSGPGPMSETITQRVVSAVSNFHSYQIITNFIMLAPQ